MGGRDSLLSEGVAGVESLVNSVAKTFKTRHHG